MSERWLNEYYYQENGKRHPVTLSLKIEEKDEIKYYRENDRMVIFGCTRCCDILKIIDDYLAKYLRLLKSEKQTIKSKHFNDFKLWSTKSPRTFFNIKNHYSLIEEKITKKLQEYGLNISTDEEQNCLKYLVCHFLDLVKKFRGEIDGFKTYLENYNCYPSINPIEVKHLRILTKEIKYLYEEELKNIKYIENLEDKYTDICMTRTTKLFSIIRKDSQNYMANFLILAISKNKREINIFAERVSEKFVNEDILIDIIDTTPD